MTAKLKNMHAIYFTLNKIKHISLHKSAMGLDTSYDNILSSSSFTVNGKHIRIKWCKHTLLI